MTWQLLAMLAFVAVASAKPAFCPKWQEPRWFIHDVPPVI